MAAKKARKAPARKGATKKPGARKAAPKKAPAARKAAPKKAAARKASFGRAGTAGKAEGDAPVKAYISALPPDHREIARRLDALIAELVPGVRRALKWSTPMYGLEGQGWFASVASFKDYVSLVFFRGASLKPPPPFGESKEMRRVNIHDMGEYDEKQFRSWIKQASSMQGWGTVR